MGSLFDRVRLTIPGPVAARPFDAVLVIEPAVEPDRRVEGAVLVNEQVGQLVLERLRVGARSEIAAELFAGAAGLRDVAPAVREVLAVAA